jgi:predicted metalloprotease with PDZ domain
MKNAFFKVTIDLTSPESHRAKVKIEKRSENLPGLLEFPVWTPGSYLVREYSRHVTRLEPAQKVAKNRWRVESGTREVNYEVYCFERTVRTSYLDANYAVLVGATLLPLLHGPYEVELRTPKNWKLVSSSLNFRRHGPGHFLASVRDDDHWIDSPIVAAAPGYGDSGKFVHKGITHHIAWVGQECGRPMRELEAAFAKIAGATVQLFGGSPFREYWFLLQFGHRLYGGLEHRDSQLTQFDGATLSEQKDWDNFLRLVAHEYFHSWNVKSIRPRALGPFDYSVENYTQDIWFAEGITDYFDDMLALNAGLISAEAYWKARLKDASLLPDGLPGHTRRSLAETSFDAWIRYYRGDEDSINTDVSYYAKGALLGWCWDALLQKKSKKKWNLARLLREIYREFGIDAYEPLAAAKPGFTREELFAFAERITKIPQARQLEGWITNRKSLPWREAARFFGQATGEKITDSALHHLGIVLQWRNGVGVVQKVISGSAAEEAGISPHDELIGLRGTRVADAEKFQLTLSSALKKGRSLDLLVARLDKLLSTRVRWRKHPGIGVEYGHK